VFRLFQGESTCWPICVPSVPTFGTRLKDGKRWYLCSKHSTSTHKHNERSPYVFDTMAGPGLASYISDPQTGELFHDHSRGGEDVPKEPFTKGIKIESKLSIFSLSIRICFTDPEYFFRRRKHIFTLAKRPLSLERTTQCSQDSQLLGSSHLDRRRWTSL